MLPPHVSSRLDGSLGEYWRRRAAQHTRDSYAGVAMSKFPEDLRVYEHLLWEMEASAVIEIGTHQGGSALWFRDRLVALARYRRETAPVVVSLDIEIEPARVALAAVDPSYTDSIKLVEADVTDPAAPERVAALLPQDARCLVVEDSAHVYETTRAALDSFAPFVPPGGFFVVEDGCVDIEEMRISEDWPRGVLPALRDWLATPAGSAFQVRRDLELYGISCHPEGFLQRASSAA